MVQKIAFLFLTIGNIYHESTWVKFFKNHEHQYSLYVHPKNELSVGSFFSRAVIQQREQTRWENTMKAQIALLREALKDPANTKFVFLSESTIPLMPFQGVYDYVLSHPNSEFNYELNTDGYRTFNTHGKIYKNSQWIVLNRKHAQLMVNDISFIEIFATVPFDNEHYPSTFLAHQNLLHEVKNRPTTVVVWKEQLPHPHLFNDFATDPYTKYIIKGIRNKLLFARKIGPTCNLSFLHNFVPQLY